MKNYKSSDYAANKFSKGIVYRFANETITVTQEEYLRENPDKTISDFTMLKTLSDASFLEQDRKDNAQSQKLVPHDVAAENICSATFSPENLLIAAEDNQQQRRLINQALNQLTKIQRERYILICSP